MSARHPNITSLRAVHCSQFSTSTSNTAYVVDVGDYFQFLVGSNLTPVANYVIPSLDGTGQWLRMGLPNASLPSGPFFTTATVTALRAITGVPQAQARYHTRGYLASGDGGGWPYEWSTSSTATDDGVLVIKAMGIPVGRFLAVIPGDAIISALACGPAAADVSRTKSFDPTGVVDIGTEMYRITQLLARAGWKGIDFGASTNTYSVATNIRIAPRAKSKGFIIRGGKFVGPVITSAPTAIGYYARGKGEAEASAPGQLMSVGYRTQTWTQTMTGGELTMTGVAQVAGTATVPVVAGDTCVLRIGAEKRDAGGWSSSSYFAEAVTVTPTSGNSANILFREPLDYVPPVGVGINPTRIQTQHDLVPIDAEGFQDGTVFDNVLLDNVFLTGVYDRDTRWPGLRWTQTNFGINTTGSQRISGDLMFEWATGYGGGHYGNPIILQACNGTKLDIRGKFNVDTIVDHELSSKGTEIGLMDVAWDARSTGTGTVNLVSSEEFPTTIKNLVLRGGYGSVSMSATTSVTLMTAYNSDVTLVSVRAGNCDAISYNGVLYKGKRQFSTLGLLVASATTDIILPIKGLFRSIRVRTTSMTGVTSADWVITGSASFARGSAFSQWVANQWNDDGPAAVMYGSYNVSRYTGYQAVSLRVGCDGTLPANTVIYIEGEVFVPELAVVTGVVDTSYPQMLGGNGAPATSANFIGQGYTDLTSAPRKAYQAISTGAGAADWVALS